MRLRNIIGFMFNPLLVVTGVAHADNVVTVATTDYVKGGINQILNTLDSKADKGAVVSAAQLVAGGQTGQILQKTANGMQWVNKPSGGNNISVNPNLQIFMVYIIVPHLIKIT